MTLDCLTASYSVILIQLKSYIENNAKRTLIFYGLFTLRIAE